MGPLARLQQWDTLILNRVFQGVRYRQRLTRVVTRVSRTGDGPLYVVIGVAVWLADIPRAEAFCLALILAFAIERPFYFLLKIGLKRNRPEQVMPGIKRQSSLLISSASLQATHQQHFASLRSLACC